jgi:hypothetical protein
MRLNRLGPNSHHADSNSYSDDSPYIGGKDEGERVYNHFKRFGTGTENFNDFNVSLEWSDVEAITRTFFEMGLPEAVRLDRARKLAAAVEEFAKSLN